MITLRAALLSACLLAALFTVFMPERAQVAARSAPRLPAPLQTAGSLAGASLTEPAAVPEQEWAESQDTTGLLDEQLDVDRLVDEINADTGEGFEPVNREELASLLQDDAGPRQQDRRAP